VQLSKICTRDKQFSGSLLQADSMSLAEVEQNYISASENLNLDPEIADSLVGIAFRGPALQYFLKLPDNKKQDTSVVFATMSSRYIPGSMLRATKENRATFSWNKLVAEYPEVTDPTNLAQLLQEKIDSMQEKLPDEYSSDVHRRNLLMKCMSQTPFKRFIRTSRLTSSTEVTIVTARSVELHREEFAYRPPIHSTVGRYPRRFVHERTPSTNYESQDTKEDKSEETELDFHETTNPHDQLQIDQIFLTDLKYTTRVNATDDTRGSNVI
jgi:hypothetical protein